MTLANLSIKQKLLLLLTLPLLATLYFSGNAIIKDYQVKQELLKLQQLSELGILIGNYVHESQKERGMTAGFLGSKGQKFADKLPTQRQTLNQRLEAFETYLNQFNKHNDNPALTERIQGLQQKLSQLNSIRQQVSQQTISTPKAIGFYTQLNAQSLDVISYMMRLAPTPEIVLQVGAYVNFLQAKERAGIERAVLTNTFAADRFAPGMYQKFIELLNAQNNYLKVFNDLATPEATKRLQQILSHNSVTQVEQMRQVALQKADTGHFGIDPNHWFSTITQKT